jgi:S1-C subfamily serine protease
MAGGPAAKAGVKQGDVIISFAAKPVRDVQQLQRIVADTPVGRRVEMEVFRAGRAMKLSIVTGSQESAEAMRPRPEDIEPAAWFGLTVEDLPPQMRARGLAGVLVTEVEDGSIAGEAGIQAGDVIVAVNQKRILNLSEYTSAIREAGKKGSVALLVKRGDASIYFALRTR